VRLDAHLHVVMRGAVPLLLQYVFMAWCWPSPDVRLGERSPLSVVCLGVAKHFEYLSCVATWLPSRPCVWTVVSRMWRCKWDSIWRSFYWRSPRNSVC